MNFFETENNKPVKTKMGNKTFGEYKDICITVFGGVLYDVTWTLNNPIFKAEANKRKWQYIKN